MVRAASPAKRGLNQITRHDHVDFATYWRRPGLSYTRHPPATPGTYHAGIVAGRSPPTHPAAPPDVRRCDRGLLADEIHARDNAEDPLPVPSVGNEECAPARPGH